TDARGRLACDLALEADGEILLEARSQDSGGRSFLTTRSVWAQGEGNWWFENGASDRMDVLPERSAYESGETARLQVRMPFQNAIALVTSEREGVLDARVVRLSGREPVVEIPIVEAHSPNIFVSVLAVRGRVTDWRAALQDPNEIAVPPGEIDSQGTTALVDLAKPSWRLGMAALNVGWKPHRLEVQVTPERDSYKTRESAQVKVLVRRSDGQPLPAGSEIAFAAVDEALLELKPNTSWDVLTPMMQPRGLEVLSATAQMQVVGKRHYGRKALPHGGGGGRQPSRELFDTLLLWQGRVALDEQGAAALTVPLNDSLTSFKLTAVAQGGAGLFGQGGAAIRTTQDLMLLAGLPPVVREGDRFQAGFTLRNASDRSLPVTLTAHLTPKAGGAWDLEPQFLTLAPGQAQGASWAVTVPPDAGELEWQVAATEQGEGPNQASDHLKTRQTVLPVHPVRVTQASLIQIDASGKNPAIPVQIPAGAIPGRGGLRLSLRAKLGDGLGGMTEYMQRYPYGCLEQRASKAIALRDRGQWDGLMNQLPTYQDAQGLFRYFPTDRLEGSEVLTSYLLAIAAEAEWPLPDATRDKALNGLKAFATGQLKAARAAAAQWPDLTLRRLAAMAALSAYGQLPVEAVTSLTPEPARWPAATVIDWLQILQRLPALPERAKRLKEGETVLRGRLSPSGTALRLSNERDGLWWLMQSADLAANRMILGVLALPGWKADGPRLAQGALDRQRQGRWDLTTANAWGRLAFERFSAAYEKQLVSGYTEAELAGQKKGMQWTDQTRQNALNFPWPTDLADLTLRHKGTGKPWVIVQSRAAIPRDTPISAGYRLTRDLVPVEQKSPGRWSPGDVARVRLMIEANADMTWVVADDPVPAGATILGSGLGRDSALLTLGERREGGTAPIFEERSFAAYRAYWDFLPQGKTTLEYTIRLNNPGEFALPASRVEAMYAPDQFAENPNPVFKVAE
ncbi:MAG: alpha-2-macroglobulin family protein, partial [Pseudomonadota bacterium]